MFSKFTLYLYHDQEWLQGLLLPLKDGEHSRGCWRREREGRQPSQSPALRRHWRVWGHDGLAMVWSVLVITRVTTVRLGIIENINITLVIHYTQYTNFFNHLLLYSSSPPRRNFFESFHVIDHFMIWYIKVRILCFIYINGAGNAWFIYNLKKWLL